MGVLPLAVCKWSHLFEVTTPHAYRSSQAERLVSDDGEESTHHPTMAGRIFRIVATKSHHEYVIMEAFSVSGSRDSRYGMPTLHANHDHKYHTILPSVSQKSLSLHPPLITHIRIYRLFSTLNMTAKAVNAVIFRMGKQWQRPQLFIPPTTNSS